MAGEDSDREGHAVSCIAIGIDCFAGGASPKTILGASLVAWYRADLGISLGTGVSAWADQSGNGNNFVQATGAQQPTQGTVDGKPALVFSGTQALTGPTTFPSGAKSCYVVFQLSATPGSGLFDSLVTLYTGSLWTELLLSNISGAYTNVTFEADFASGNGVGWNPTLDTSKHIIGVTYNGGTNTSPASYTGWEDGSVQTIIASSALGRTAGDLSSIGGRVSSLNVISAGFVGSIAEIILTNNVISGAQATTLQAYLTGRYP